MTLQLVQAPEIGWLFEVQGFSRRAGGLFGGDRTGLKHALVPAGWAMPQRITVRHLVTNGNVAPSLTCEGSRACHGIRSRL